METQTVRVRMTVNMDTKLNQRVRFWELSLMKMDRKLFNPENTQLRTANIYKDVARHSNKESLTLWVRMPTLLTIFIRRIADATIYPEVAQPKIAETLYTNEAILDFLHKALYRVELVSSV